MHRSVCLHCETADALGDKNVVEISSKEVWYTTGYQGPLFYVLIFTVDVIMWLYNAGAHPEFFTRGGLGWWPWGCI
jgi:hypothetical protein